MNIDLITFGVFSFAVAQFWKEPLSYLADKICSKIWPNKIVECKHCFAAAYGLAMIIFATVFSK